MVVIGIILGGCQKGAINSELREAVVKREGMIVAKSGEEFLLDTGEEIVNLTSNKINLDEYLKKRVAVEGMFSGSTLYVDELKEE